FCAQCSTFFPYTTLFRSGVDILLRFQPVASDLRRVVAAMKLSSNLERMADQATTIARRARKLNQHPPLPEVELIRPMYEHAMSIDRKSTRLNSSHRTISY